MYFQFTALSLSKQKENASDKDYLSVEKVLGKQGQVFSHAVGQHAKGGGTAGGTLSVAVTKSGVVASGGGDTSCCFYFYDAYQVAKDGWLLLKTRSTRNHTAGVSAVALEGTCAVSGGKDGVSESNLTVFKSFCACLLHPLLIKISLI